MAKSMKRLFDELPAGQWVCWDRPPVMYVCYDSDVCSYYPMDTGIESHGPFPLFSWEYAMAADGRGGFYVTGGHDENRQVRVEDPYSVRHKPPYPDSFFGPIISELWRYDIRENRWEEVDQTAWGPRQCVGGRHMVCDTERGCLVRTAGSSEGHSPRPPVPLRGWATFGVWTFDTRKRAWTWMRPSNSAGPLTYDTRRRVVLGFRDGRVAAYDAYSNSFTRRPRPSCVPEGEGAFAYDECHDLCLFYGNSGETWSYDIEANAWTRRNTGPRPEPRKGFGFALDPETGTALLFGGRSKAGLCDDTWLYRVEDSAWQRVNGAVRPEARSWIGPGVVFDRATRAFVLYGGLASYERVKARYATGDVWVFKLPRARRKKRRSLKVPRRPDPAVPGLPVVSVLEDGAVRLSWPAVPGGDVAGYQVRRTRILGNKRYVNETLFDVGAAPAFEERPHGLPGRHYQYQVRAVDKNDVCGGWSAPASTIPSAPARLGMTPDRRRRCIVLRWPASPEEGIAGYNLYRWVEPPFRFRLGCEAEPIVPAWWSFDERKNPAARMQWVKVNDEPIRGTRYTDRDLKIVTTWYYIRAVNVLGVEGHFRTSYAMPVWRWYTEARQFY